MSTHVHTAKVFVPYRVQPPRLALLFGRVLDALSAAFASTQRRREDAALRHQVARDAAAARREAAMMMRYDPRVAAELLAAADRHESMYL